MQTNYNNGNFKVFSSMRITTGTGWESMQESTLSDTIENLLDSEFKVFEFETPEELFSWLAIKERF